MNRKQIDEMLNRYLDGATTNEEERILRLYFSTTQIVPTEWEAYKALFSWEARQHDSTSHGHSVLARTAQRPSQHHYFAIAASIAALLIIGAGIATMLQHSLSKNYAIIDGHYTTDAATIRSEAEEALLMVGATDDETFDAIDILAIP